MLLVGTVSTFLPPWFCKIIKNSYYIDMILPINLSRIKDANTIYNFEQEQFLRGFMYRVQIEEWILVNSKKEDEMNAKNRDAK